MSVKKNKPDKMYTHKNLMLSRIFNWRILAIIVLIFGIGLYSLISFVLANGVTKADREPFSHLPQEYNLEFQDVEFLTRGNNTTLRGWFIQSANETHTLIFVHGLNNNRAGDEALDLASRLSKEGFSVLMFDLRGHGTSDDGRVSGGYFEQNDLLGAYDFLVNRGVHSNQIGIVGFSLGAAISILTAAKEPAIKAVVSDTTYADISDLIVQEVDRTTSLPKWIIPIFKPGTILVANLLYGIKIGELVPEQSVVDIKYPILIIHGMEDTRIPSAHSVRVHAASHPDSEIWLVPNVEHIDSFLTYPDEYTDRLIDYFTKQLDQP